MLDYSLLRGEFRRAKLEFHSFQLLLGLIRMALVAEASDKADRSSLTELEDCIILELHLNAPIMLEWHQGRSKKDMQLIPRGNDVTDLGVVSVHGRQTGDILSLLELSPKSLAEHDRVVLREMFKQWISDAAATGVVQPLHQQMGIS